MTTQPSNPADAILIRINGLGWASILLSQTPFIAQRLQSIGLHRCICSPVAASTSARTGLMFWHTLTRVHVLRPVVQRPPINNTHTTTRVLAIRAAVELFTRIHRRQTWVNLAAGRCFVVLCSQCTLLSTLKQLLPWYDRLDVWTEPLLLTTLSLCVFSL